MRDKDLNNGKGLRKTVVLYDLKRQIVGKALFNIGLDFPTSLEHNNAPTLINLRIDQVKSMVSANSHIDLSLRDNLFEAKNYLIEHLQLLQSYKVSIVQPLYLTKLVL